MWATALCGGKQVLGHKAADVPRQVGVSADDELRSKCC
jgi:hypothetical protein